ncbi:MAG: glycosyltransferase, partial [Phycisphaerae bacterium]|nr:glycosyltransferase [Phycisphaerae bacterium]
MNLYEKALALSRRGDYEQASSHFKEYLEANPDDARAWNDAGVVLFSSGRCPEAIDHLERARDLQYDPACVDYNLFCAYAADDRAAEAVELFEAMCSSGIADDRKVSEAVSMLLGRDDAATAAELLVCAKRWLPTEHLEALLQGIRRRRAKIAFFCGGDGDTFLKDILDFARERFEVRVFDGDKVDQVQNLMVWSDISWFEWCTNLAEIGSKLPRVCRTIVRLHRYEAYSGWAGRINWENIDALVTVGNRCVDEMLEQQVPGLQYLTRRVTIPNGVNLEKIRFVRRKRGKNIAFVGNLRLVKNPMFVLQCMKRLCDIDPAYRLFIAGRTQELEVEQYVRHMIGVLGLKTQVLLDGWQEDVPGWLADKHYIVLTSVIESQGMGMLEGMAAGLQGLVHHFPGAEGIFPAEMLFNTAEEFCG